MPKLISVGHLEAKKRPLDAIEVARKLHDRMEGIELVWIGEGELRKEVDEYLNRNRIDFVSFLGTKSEKEKWRLLKSSSLYISTSIFEGFNIPIAEAFLAGLPAIAYDLPVYREVYRDTVLYVPLFDIELFARKAEQVLEDTSLSKRLAEEGKRLVIQEYSPENVAEKIESVLKKVVTSNRRWSWTKES